MKFGDILRELREEKGLTQKELGTIINISDRVIGYWESNNRFPKDSTIIVELANFFGVSTDYLLNNTNNKGNESNKYSNEEVKLINCYRLSSNDDKNVIWAVLNKYKKSEDRKKEAT